MSDREYRLDPVDRWLRLYDGEDPVLEIPPSGALAILYDETDGVLHKHGDHHHVLRRHQHMWKTLHGAGHRDLATSLTLVAFPVKSITQPQIDDANACLAITGRVKGLKDRHPNAASTRDGFVGNSVAS